MALVETLLPSRDDERQALHQRTRASVYELLLEHVYPEDDPPQPADVGETHDLIPVPRKDWLDALDTMDRRVLDALRRDEDLLALYARLDELAGFAYLGPVDGSDGDGGGTEPEPAANGVSS